MFLFTLGFYFEKCTFISPSLLGLFWCIIRLMQKNNGGEQFQRSVGWLDVIANYIQLDSVEKLEAISGDLTELIG